MAWGMLGTPTWEPGSSQACPEPSHPEGGIPRPSVPFWSLRAKGGGSRWDLETQARRGGPPWVTGTMCLPRVDTQKALQPPALPLCPKPQGPPAMGQ